MHCNRPTSPAPHEREPGHKPAGPWLSNSILLAMIIALALSTTGCVYFNTFYLARKNFNQAESSRKKEKRDKASGSELKGYQEAIRKSSKVLSENPNSSWVDDALFVIGKSYYYLGDYARSERMFRDLLSSFPESKYADESRFFLGKSRYRLENHELAREVFTEYIQNSKNDDWRAEATYLMAEMSRADERIEEAIEYYQEFNEKYKSDFRRQEVQFKIGELQFQKERFGDAERAFALAADLASEPKSKLTARYEQGRALYELDSINAGLDLFEELREEQRDSVYLGNILLRIAEGKNRRGEERDAILLYDDIAVNFAKRIESAEAYYRLGEIAQNQWGDLITAKDMYLQASKEQRGDLWRAQALEKVSDISRVETYLASLASDTTEAAVNNRFLLAEMYRTDLDRPDSALAEYKVIVDKYASSEVAPRALLAIGWLYENHYTDSAKAQVYYQQVVDNYPKSDAVRRAIDLLQISDAEPFDMYPDKLFGMAEEQYFDHHNLDSARTLFERLVAEYPQSRFVPRAEFAVARIDLERFVPQNKVISPSISAPPADSVTVPTDTITSAPIDSAASSADSTTAIPSDSTGLSIPEQDTLLTSPAVDSLAPSDSSQLPVYVNPTDSLIRPSEVLGRNRRDQFKTAPVDSADTAVSEADTLQQDLTAHQRILDAVTKGKSTSEQVDTTKSGLPPDSTAGKQATAKDSLLTKLKSEAGAPGASIPAGKDSTAQTAQSGQPIGKDSTSQTPQTKPPTPAVPKDTILIDSTMIWRFLELAEKYEGTPIGDEASRLAQGEVRRTPKPQQQQQQQTQAPGQQNYGNTQDSLVKVDSTAAEPLDTLTQALIEEQLLQKEYELWPLMEYKPTNEIEFKYPLEAAPSKFEGRVVVKIKIEFDGKVSDVQFLKGSKISSIDLEIDRVLRLTEFDPLRIDPLKIGNYFIYNYEIRLPEEYR